MTIPNTVKAKSLPDSTGASNEARRRAPGYRNVAPSVSRRHLLAAMAAAAAMPAAAYAAATTQVEAAGYFTLAQRGGRWWLLTPTSEAFFSRGLNHFDSSTLRYPENADLWEGKYQNDQLRWIRESVAPNLKQWGFNSVGWVQEVSILNRAHTPSFTFEEYQALDLPYCHLLPFSEMHQWNPWHKNPDFFAREFEVWCDYVARDARSRMKDDPKLIGHFYVDCPTWVHTRPGNAWRGPLFDPAKLATDEGKAELSKLATGYYQVTHDAIRRYDGPLLRGKIRAHRRPVVCQSAARSPRKSRLCRRASLRYVPAQSLSQTRSARRAGASR